LLGRYANLATRLATILSQVLAGIVQNDALKVHALDVGYAFTDFAQLDSSAEVIIVGM
jgi:hypothetical protein